ncbi:MAG TPA: glycerol-3-phosphate acyltransferase [Mobilitalea sp.]|nr:glycerol-3-phosphate acyltransferase [Mobilitalea sp.]
MWEKGIVIILSYLMGCFNTGYYYVKLRYGQDVRTVGINVTGAYNVSKVAGKLGFIITFLGDALKGGLSVLLCRWLNLSDTMTMISILLVIVGHIFPFQLKFKGGKGLSTAFGAFLAFHPLWVIYWFLTCVIFFPIFRRYTITCLFALMLLPLELFIGNYPWKMIVFAILYAILILFACRNNLLEYVKARAYQGWGKGKDDDIQ